MCLDGRELADDMVEVETSTLTPTQTAAVKRRVDALNATLRRSDGGTRHGDIRDIFTQGSTQPPAPADDKQVINIDTYTPEHLI